MSGAECQSWFCSSGFLVVSPGSQKSCGCVIILFCPCLSLVSFSSDAGRFVLWEFRFHEKLFRVVSLYASNRNPARDQFLDQVSSWVDPAVPTVICGDFNMVLDRSLLTVLGMYSLIPTESTSILVSISLVVHVCGFPPSCHLKWFSAFSLTIVLSFRVLLFRMLYPWVPGCAN